MKQQNDKAQYPSNPSQKNIFNLFEKVLENVAIEDLSSSKHDSCLIVVKKRLSIAFFYWLLDRYFPKNAISINIKAKQPSISEIDLVKELWSVHTDIKLSFDIQKDSLQFQCEDFIGVFNQIKIFDASYANNKSQSIEIYKSILDHGVAWLIQTYNETPPICESFNRLKKIYDLKTSSLDETYESVLKVEQLMTDCSIKRRLFQVAYHVLRLQLENSNSQMQTQIERYVLCISQWDRILKDFNFPEYLEERKMVAYKNFISLIWRLVSVCNSTQSELTRQSLRNESIAIYGDLSVRSIVTHKIYTTEGFDGYRSYADMVTLSIEDRERLILESILESSNTPVILSPKGKRHSKFLLDPSNDRMRKTSSAEEMIDEYTLWINSLKSQAKIVSQVMKRKKESENKDDITPKISSAQLAEPASFFQEFFLFIKSVWECVIELCCGKSMFAQKVTAVQPMPMKINSPSTLEENLTEQVAPIVIIPPTSILNSTSSAFCDPKKAHVTKNALKKVVY